MLYAVLLKLAVSYRNRIAIWQATSVRGAPGTGREKLVAWQLYPNYETREQWWAIGSPIGRANFNVELMCIHGMPEIYAAYIHVGETVVRHLFNGLPAVPSIPCEDTEAEAAAMHDLAERIAPLIGEFIVDDEIVIALERFYKSGQ